MRSRVRLWGWVANRMERKVIGDEEVKELKDIPF